MNDAVPRLITIKHIVLRPDRPAFKNQVTSGLSDIYPVHVIASAYSAPSLIWVLPGSETTQNKQFTALRGVWSTRLRFSSHQTIIRVLYEVQHSKMSWLHTWGSEAGNKHNKRVPDRSVVLGGRMKIVQLQLLCLAWHAWSRNSWVVLDHTFLRVDWNTKRRISRDV